jgi:membrane-bound lytic murein transglycosylase D
MIAHEPNQQENHVRKYGAVTIAQQPVSSSIQQYEQEESLLAHILAYYEKIVVAHREGDFGLAETLVDSAFIAYGKVNLDEIADQALVARFASLGSSLAKEYGQILMESEQISQEDPESWIPDLADAEQFKSGQWTYEELNAIVKKISRKCDIPIDFNERVRNMIYFFQTRGRDVMTKWQKRSSRYMPMFQEIFVKEGLPADLAYLSMVESGLNPTVVSRARAVGLWQFIYTTGKLYGLERNEWIDERRDPVKSTYAAAQHLKDLYRLYDDWNLVMAAYNCGAGRVARSIQSGVNDYWRIDLPRETDNYVPTFMAALIISKAPDIFGFENIEKEPFFEYDTAEVRPYTSLSDAAKCAGVDIEFLKLLNSELLRDHTPAGKESYQLRIPKGTSEQFLAEYFKLPEEKFAPPQPPPSLVYRVRSGDTLSAISRKHGVSVKALMDANNLRKTITLRIGQKLSIPASGERSRAAVQPSSRPTASRPNGISGGTIKYTVKKEDTLWALANRYNTTIDALLAINNLSDSAIIQVGQTILVPRKDDKNLRERGTVGSPVDSNRDAGSESITYIVQKNDSLYVIAQKYGVNYKDIMQWNNIKDHRMIKPGDRLLIKTKS